MSPDDNGSLAAEYHQFLPLGVDGLFRDLPDLTLKVRNQCLRDRGTR
ncbi:MAG TPA: hypothetical protein V6D19_16655 [Stenomitos sp.]